MRGVTLHFAKMTSFNSHHSYLSGAISTHVEDKEIDGQSYDL